MISSGKTKNRRYWSYDISVQVGQTPQGWNGSIFSMIENLSNSIMVPIAGVILAIVMTVDPVSYTHLDVYKRQGYILTGMCRVGEDVSIYVANGDVLKTTITTVDACI